MMLQFHFALLVIIVSAQIDHLMGLKIHRDLIGSFVDGPLARGAVLVFGRNVGHQNVRDLERGTAVAYADVEHFLPVGGQAQEPQQSGHHLAARRGVHPQHGAGGAVEVHLQAIAKFVLAKKINHIRRLANSII